MRRFLLVVVLAAVLLCLQAAPAFAATFYVPPSGGDDTARIQGAFDLAAKAGPGITVMLGPGKFYTDTIFVQDFKGIFKGSGQGVTVIDTLRALDPNAPGLTVRPDVEPFPFLFGFKGGNVKVSDMSFDITAPQPAEPFNSGHLFIGGSGRTDLAEVVLVTGNASSAFDRVGFTAGGGGSGGPNVAGSIGIIGKAVANADGAWLSLGPTGGVHKVTRCSFTGNIGLEVWGLTGGRLTAGGSETMRNVFVENWSSFLLFDISNSRVEISHNEMTAWGLNLVVVQSMVAANSPVGAPLPPLPAARYVITDNDIICRGGSMGMWLVDLSKLACGAAGRIDALIADNDIVLAPPVEPWGCGINEYSTEDVKVLHNRFSGSGGNGIYIGDDVRPDGTGVYPVSDWKIIGNDFRDLDAEMASIYLGEGSTHCLVVCPTTTDVIDRGIGNILVNVNLLPAPVAAQASARMAPLRQVAPL